MFFTGDPAADYERYCDEQERLQQEQPICEICNDSIEDEYCFEVNDAIICEECLNKWFRKKVCDI